MEYNNLTSLKGLALLPSLEVLNLGWNRVSSFFGEELTELFYSQSGDEASTVKHLNRSVVVIAPDDNSGINQAFLSAHPGGDFIPQGKNEKCDKSVFNEKYFNQVDHNGSSNFFIDNKSKMFARLQILALHSNHLTSLEPLLLSLFPKLNTLMVQDNEICNLLGKFINMCITLLKECI